MHENSKAVVRCAADRWAQAGVSVDLMFAHNIVICSIRLYCFISAALHHTTRIKLGFFYV